MRHVVYLLLVANLLYLGWSLSRVEVEADPTAGWPELPDDVAKLVTLQEMRQQPGADRKQAGYIPPVVPAADAPAAEQKLTAADAGTAEPERVTQADPPAAGQNQCQSLGPFSAHEVVESVAGRLNELGLAPRERVDTVREEDGFWVYLPAMPPQEASKVIALLKRNGDRDYFRGRDNYIALGTFTEVSRAERRLEQLRTLGLEPEMSQRFTEREIWWLEFRMPAVDVLGELLERYPDLQVDSIECT